MHIFNRAVVCGSFNGTAINWYYRFFSWSTKTNYNNYIFVIFLKIANEKEIADLKNRMPVASGNNIVYYYLHFHPFSLSFLINNKHKFFFIEKTTPLSSSITDGTNTTTSTNVSPPFNFQEIHLLVYLG